MNSEKIVLARCRKINRKYCLEIKQSGQISEVVNFIELSDDEYHLLSTDIHVDRIRSANNLIPCRYCGSRAVAGCSCNRKRKQCESYKKYDFQCLYCDSLIIDEPTATNKKIVVTLKHWDDIGEVLSSMNLEFSSFCGEYNCDILFINCGTSDPINAKDLASFVYNGGCLYASDLSSSHIQAAFPGMLSYSNIGTVCKIHADVCDTELLQIAGKQIEIEFDLGGWSVIEKTKGQVLLRASQGSIYAGKPIMVSFRYGKGIVFYTSFHNHAQASEKEKMLLQLLLMKQIGASSHKTIEQVGSLLGLNISTMKERFSKK